MNCQIKRLITQSSQQKLVTNLQEIYNQKVVAGLLRRDLNQEKAVELLQQRSNLYLNYLLSTSEQLPKSSWLSIFRKKSQKAYNDIPRGLYIYGSVGSGKTMLMDMLHKSILDSSDRSYHKYVKRVHYHPLMQQLHQSRHLKKSIGGLEALKLLFIDEFQVTDIADAMILYKLLDQFHQNGTILVFTSNRHPDELYKNGIQRDSFIPCINHIKKVNQIVNLDGEQDYRTLEESDVQGSNQNIAWFQNKKDLLRYYQNLSQVNNSQSKPYQLTVWSRPVNIPLQDEKSQSCLFTFDQLCGQSWSSSEYIAITSNYKFIFVSDMPYLDLSYLLNPHQIKKHEIISRDVIRRFITFIDCAYENQSVVVLQSDKVSSVKDLFNKDMYNEDFIGSAEEEIFATKRSISRLIQMQSYSWTKTLSEQVNKKQKLI